MEKGTNSPRKAMFPGQVSVFQSPHANDVMLVDVARANKHDQLEWCAIQHDDPIYGMAVQAYKNATWPNQEAEQKGGDYLTEEQFANCRQLILKDMGTDKDWCENNNVENHQLIAEYPGHCFICVNETDYQLIIGNAEYGSENLAELESVLYKEWFIPEIVGSEKANIARGIYTIEIEVPYDSGLHAKLQKGYDDGAAGFFRLENVANKTYIVFERNLADDADYLEQRIANGASLADAACWQLADEFEEFNEDSLGEVIETLRSPHSKVSGLTNKALEAQRVIESPAVGSLGM